MRLSGGSSEGMKTRTVTVRVYVQILSVFSTQKRDGKQASESPLTSVVCCPSVPPARTVRCAARRARSAPGGAPGADRSRMRWMYWKRGCRRPPWAMHARTMGQGAARLAGRPGGTQPDHEHSTHVGQQWGYTKGLPRRELHSSTPLGYRGRGVALGAGLLAGPLVNGSLARGWHTRQQVAQRRTRPRVAERHTAATLGEATDEGQEGTLVAYQAASGHSSVPSGAALQARPRMKGSSASPKCVLASRGNSEGRMSTPTSTTPGPSTSSCTESATGSYLRRTTGRAVSLNEKREEEGRRSLACLP